MSQIPGPNGPIYFTRDALGYPKIMARHFLDGTYARGYLHAKDRLLQIHITLQMARGRLMEVVGDEPFARMMDRAVRAHNLAGDLDQQVAQLTPETHRFLQVYCDGFNACPIPKRQRLMFRLLGLPLEPMQPASLLLTYRIVSYFGLTSMQHLAEVVIAELIDENVPVSVLETLIGPAARHIDFAALSQMRLAKEDYFLAPPHLGGSNAFAVNAERSASGHALLMSEFHMEIGRFPPVLYACHVEHATGDYYQGIGVPGLAWFSAGRTPDVGWAYTFGHADNLDFVVERCRRGRYLAEGEWRPLQIREERVSIRGKRDPEIWTYYESDYGTVMGDASHDGDYPCVRWSGLDQSASCVNAAHNMIFSRDIEEFAQQQRGIRTISLCAIIADRHGHIARIHAGQVDQRPDNWGGAFPRPGWTLSPRPPAPLPETSRPLDMNPLEGFAVSANEHAEGPNGENWTSLPEPHYRHRRISALLKQQPQATLQNLVQISYDEFDLCAHQMLQVWQPLLPEDPQATDLCAWAASQNGRATPRERQVLGFFHTLYQEVVREMLLPHLGADKTQRFLHDFTMAFYFQHHVDPVLRLEHPERVDRNTLQRWIHNAWPRAIALSQQKDWSFPLHAPFHNVLTQGKLPSLLGFSQPARPIPGGPVAPFQSRKVHLNALPLYFGPVFHYVIDMGQEGGWYNMTGGASESRFGPGYGAGVDEWLRGDFRPLGNPEGLAPSLNDKPSF